MFRFVKLLSNLSFSFNGQIYVFVCINYLVNLSGLNRRTVSSYLNTMLKEGLLCYMPYKDTEYSKIEYHTSKWQLYKFVFPNKSLEDIDIHEVNKKCINDLLRNEEEQPLHIE